jgi:predicted nucleic acid-binding protein
VILADSSAWIELLRDTGSAVCEQLDSLVASERAAELATCDPVRLEVLAGARSERHLEDLERLLARTTLLPIEPGDFDVAAALYRSCRRSGETVRRLFDCLIAAVAIRTDTAVLHADADFDVLARHTPLRIAAA